MKANEEMPGWVEPMAATLTHERVAGDDWLFERKFDGIRLLAYKRGADVRLYSRNRLPQELPAVAEAVAVTAVPEPAAPAGRQSLYQRLSNSPEAEAGRAKAPTRAAAATTVYVQDIPSADDETIEESGVFGRAAVERILGGKLVEERSLDGSPLPPRF